MKISERPYYSKMNSPVRSRQILDTLAENIMIHSSKKEDEILVSQNVIPSKEVRMLEPPKEPKRKIGFYPD